MVYAYWYMAVGFVMAFFIMKFMREETPPEELKVMMLKLRLMFEVNPGYQFVFFFLIAVIWPLFLLSVFDGGNDD